MCSTGRADAFPVFLCHFLPDGSPMCGRARKNDFVLVSLLVLLVFSRVVRKKAVLSAHPPDSLPGYIHMYKKKKKRKTRNNAGRLRSGK